MRIKPSSTSLFILAAGIIIGYLLGSPQAPSLISQGATPSPTTIVKPTIATDPTLHRVTKIIDGDTVEIETGQKVRYIGIDTPEMKATKTKSSCFGAEAKQRNQQLVEGKTVQLKKDVSEVDRYGRLLRYIYLYDETASKEGQFINDTLVREGYAHAVTFPPDVAFAEQFRAAEQEARNKSIGLWTTCK